MLLNYTNTDVTVEALIKEVYLPGRKGSLQIDILSSTRRHHRIPYLISPGFEPLFREMDAGNPVLVLQNLGLSWAPVWHYAVAIGYNLPQQQITLHSGTYKARTLALKTFERTWRRAKYWGMVTTTIDKIPASAEPQRFISAITTLKDGKSKHRAYIAATKRWPKQLLPRIGLGNSFYNQGNIAEAEQAYRMAVKNGPQSALALNNLAQALADQNKFDEALAIAQQAVDIGDAFSIEAQDTLNDIKKEQASH